MGQLGIIEADAILGHKMVSFFGENGFSAELHEDVRSLLTQLPNHPPRVVLLGKGRESLDAEIQVLWISRSMSWPRSRVLVAFRRRMSVGDPSGYQRFQTAASSRAFIPVTCFR